MAALALMLPLEGSNSTSDVCAERLWLLSLLARHPPPLLPLPSAAMELVSVSTLAEWVCEMMGTWWLVVGVALLTVVMGGALTAGTSIPTSCEPSTSAARSSCGCHGNK